MGLDQFAWSSERPMHYVKDDEGDPVLKPVVKMDEFYWRKHSKLQSYFEDKFYKGELKGIRDDRDFNCNPILLDLDTINHLEALLDAKKMPKSEGGFFYGHQFQDDQAEEYREQDLEFCRWARKEIAKGNHVYYDCWW